MIHIPNFCGQVHRREFLHQLGGGFTSLALTGLLGKSGFFSQAQAAEMMANPLAPREPQLPAKAKSVIFLFMYGGPSHMDTFDYKPKLYPLDGKTIPIKTFGRGGKKIKDGSSDQNGNSNNTDNAASMSPTYFPIPRNASMT
jgi:hypothetical protein